ncbi:MAG TPA: hypothetical protein VFH17_03805 [Coriobacteriia bacterium]|nr:hypothetical protein [Coriobacteriia bacterium]
MARYHGKSGYLYVQGSGAAAIPVAALTEWSLDMKRDRVEVTSFGDTNKVMAQGLPAFSGSVSGFWDDADDTLMQASEATSGRAMYIYPSRDAIAKYFYGTAWVDVSASGSMGDAVKVSGTFEAAGPWGRR